MSIHANGSGADLSHATFRHEALLYAGAADLVPRLAEFLRAGLVAKEPALVVLGSAKIRMLRAALPGLDERQVRFADMAAIGRNPARIIPAWRQFVDEHPGSRVRGVGEPIWADRTADELDECERHEALLNLALADAPMWLACPYDVQTLPASVIDEAARTHPMVWQDGRHHETVGYRGLDDVARPFDRSLSEPAGEVSELAFGGDDVADVRAFVGSGAHAAGMGRQRTQDLVLAVSEVATNSLLHGGGRGVVRLWRHGGSLACEVRDRGRFDRPLAGRERPVPEQRSGFGLWLANQLCDLVQIRSVETGSVVRLLMSLGDPA
jgi:anti-sigma regulatory factor (Ser/Thr protein kinase)